MPPPVVEMDPIVARLHEKIKQDLRLEMEALETKKQRKKEAKKIKEDAKKQRKKEAKKTKEDAAADPIARNVVTKKQKTKKPAAAPPSERSALPPPVPKAATDRIATNAERAKILAVLHTNFKKKMRADFKAEQVAAAAAEAAAGAAASAAAYAANMRERAEMDDMKRAERDVKKSIAAADKSEQVAAKAAAKAAAAAANVSREAKKEADRAKKVVIALQKAAAETAAEAASDNSIEIQVDKIIKKFYQFYKDYESEEYNRVKAKLWFDVEKDFFAMEYYDPDKDEMFIGAECCLIPINAMSPRDRTLLQKNWTVECRLRTRRLNTILQFVLMMGAAIPPVMGRILSRNLQKVFNYEANRHKLDRLMEILNSILSEARLARQDYHCSVNAALQIELLIKQPDAVIAALEGDEPDAAAIARAEEETEAEETRLQDEHTAAIEEYGPWIESAWEGFNLTVSENEQTEQEIDVDDMVVEENEDDPDGDEHTAAIEEYGPWIESAWEGVNFTVSENEQTEQEIDVDDMVVEENEDDPDGVSEGVQSSRFQRADELFFLPNGSQLSSLTKDAFDHEVRAHKAKWSNIVICIGNHIHNGMTLPENIANLNLNTANASFQYVHCKNKDGVYTKSPKKILVFKITWCIAAYCSGASGNSFCRNGDLVLRKFDRTIFVDGLGHVFDRGQFDVNVELREVAQQVSPDGYAYVPVSFSSQFIPYIYKSTMRVATLQWAGILGSFYILAETCDHLTREKENNSILCTQPASKKENKDRMDLQGLSPREGDDCSL